MATAGSIVVDLLARTGSFDTDIARSTKAAEKRMKEMEKTFNDVGAKIGATLGAYFSVQAFRGVINGVDALNDLADATGASIENLSALEDIAARTGTSFDTVGGAVVKFNQALKGTDPDSKAARALEMLGLQMEDLQKMDPAEALHRTALALAEFADDGNKARLVQELFGKSTKEVAAFLKDLADQEKLVGTVTAEDAKQAEAFNQQLAQMAKNSVDLARSLVGDLLPQLNALLKAWREGGTLGALFGVGGIDDPGKKLNEINDKLSKMRQTKAELIAGGHGEGSLNEMIFGDVADLNRQIAALEKEQKFLQSLQQSKALAGGTDYPDQLSRQLGSKPALGTLTEKAKDGKAAKPYATSDRFSAADALQRETEILNEAQEAWKKYNAAQEVTFSTTYTEADAAAMEAEILNEAMQLTAKYTKENTSLADGFGSVFGNALQGLVTGAESFNDVLKNMLSGIANLILQIGVIEPMVQSLRAAMGAGGSGGAGGLFSLLGSIFGGGGGGGFVGPPAPAGARAAGGPVSAGSSYLVGERGPELFVPRTAGMVVPNGAGGAGGPTIINQTRGRVDNVVQQQLPGGGRALILQELASEFANPNSKVSRSLQANYRLRPAR